MAHKIQIKVIDINAILQVIENEKNHSNAKIKRMQQETAMNTSIFGRRNDLG